MKPIEIKGDTVDQKFKHLERILQRFSRRLHRTIIGLVPASPIFGYCKSSIDDAIVLRAIFPVDGIITHAAMRAEKCHKNSLVVVDIVSGDEELTKTFPLKKKAMMQKVDFPIKAGDSLVIEVEDESEEGSLGVWVGLLYQVGIKDLASTKFLIDQFEALIEESQDAS